MTKTEIQAFFLKKGYQTHYSGKERTIYVRGITQLREVTDQIKDFISPFKLVAQIMKQITLEPKEFKTFQTLALEVGEKFKYKILKGKVKVEASITFLEQYNY